MSEYGGVLGGVSTSRAVAAAVMCLLVVWFEIFLDAPLTPTLTTIYVVLLAYGVADAFDSVREHPAYRLASSIWAVLGLMLLYLGPLENSPVVLAVVGLMSVNVLVEAYNYRHGTAHLRIDW